MSLSRYTIEFTLSLGVELFERNHNMSIYVKNSGNIFDYCQEASIHGEEGSNQWHWLSGDGVYADFTRALSNSDPRLLIRDPKCESRKTLWPDMPVRIRVLDQKGHQNFGLRKEFHDANTLQEYLRDHQRLPNRRYVYLVEAYGPRTAIVLGNHFQLHPSFFVEHERVKTFSYDTSDRSDAVLLPSSLSTRDHITLKYSEPMHIHQAITEFGLHCHTTGRHITITRSRDQMLPVGIVRRKCSVWHRETKGGSDVVILCDPQITSVRPDGDGNPFAVQTSSFQGGYVDFIPQNEQRKSCSGPPRLSMLDDLTFYLTNHFNLLANCSGSEGVQIFINKIIVGHYWELVNFTNATLSQAQRRLCRHTDLKDFSMTDVERDWSDAQGNERRSRQYCRELGSVMLQLNIAPCAPTHAKITDWTACEEDFQFLLSQFRNLHQVATSVNVAMTTLAGVAGNRQAAIQQIQSLREAKRTKALTFVGLVFIPLAYACALFSMADPFSPGGPLFWVYFLVAIPLVGLVALGNWILDHGYNEDASKWSIRNVLDKL
ncbi:hypothetical protein F5B20DRAFT_193927 [Whalleya microplaca]|nr:hypothetical protein F5B20DRAFT_193927 [Whalleya microplaca]